MKVIIDNSSYKKTKVEGYTMYSKDTLFVTIPNDLIKQIRQEPFDEFNSNNYK